MSLKSGLSYRPDIDGLRAVAVTLVIAYHFDGYISGGFIGVDIFFVISGFLITLILLRDLERGEFSIKHFYERRLRRIAPALIVMLSCSYLVSWFGSIPPDLVIFTKSMLSALLSYSNLYFWRNTSYFDLPSQTTPLLHTWSLAVEEQFYLVFPLLLALFYRRTSPRKLRICLVICWILSLAASVYYVRHDASGAFYLPHTRAWELLTGSLLAAEVLPTVYSALTANVLGGVGILFILFSAFRYTSATPFPGLAALLPCLGAGMVIVSGKTHQSLSRRLLSAKPLVFLGTISYSLYLWHWPIIVFLRIYPYEPKHISRLLLFSVMIVVATFSWRFVEQPFRSGKEQLSTTSVVRLTAAAGGVLLAVGIVTIVTAGFPFRFTPDENKAASYLSYDAHAVFRDKACFISDTKPLRDYDQHSCLNADTNRPNVLLIGDSHAADLWIGLHQAFPTVNLMELTAAACKPFPVPPDATPQYCQQSTEFLYKSYLHHHHVDAIILSANWSKDDPVGLGQTVDRLRATGAAVYVIGQNQLYDQPLPHLVAFSLKQDRPDLVRIHRRRGYAEDVALDELLERVTQSHGAHYVSLRRLLCRQDACTEQVTPFVPLLSDGHHFTVPGSVLVGRLIRDSNIVKL